jgi:hypothetical protein
VLNFELIFFCTCSSLQTADKRSRDAELMTLFTLETLEPRNLETLEPFINLELRESFPLKIVTGGRRRVGTFKMEHY